VVKAARVIIPTADLACSGNRAITLPDPRPPGRAPAPVLTRHRPIDTLGHRQVQRGKLPVGWVISARRA
jgi:hypothetical protein